MVAPKPLIMESEKLEIKKKRNNKNITPKNNNHQLGLIYRLFCWCSGARLYLLKKCPTDYNKYFGIGAVVLMTGIMAFISGFYAVYTVFDHLYISLAFGLLWGIMIFFLDWYLVASLKKQNKFSRELIISFPRLLLSIFIAIVISKPLELKLFEKEILQEIEVIKLHQSLTNQNLISKEFEEISKLSQMNYDLSKEIKSKESVRDRLFNLIVEEAEGRSPTGLQGRGPVYEEKKRQFDRIEIEFNDLKERNLKQIDQNNRLIIRLKENKQSKIVEVNKSSNSYNGFLARMEALSNLSEKSNSIAIANWFVILLFILVESSPILVKLMSKRGPYDEFLDAEEEMRRLDAEREISLYEFELKEELEVRRKIREIKLDKGIAIQCEYIDEIASAQKELNAIKLGKWRKEEIEKVEGNKDLVLENINKIVMEDFTLP